MSGFGVKKRAAKGSNDSDRNYECTYYKVRTENPSTEEVMPSFVPVVKEDGKYREDWTESSEEVIGTIIGVEPRSYEYTRKGKTRTGFELRVFVDFGVNQYARLDFGKSGMTNAIMNAIANGLIGKPVRLYLWASDEGYANISIKEYQEGVPVGDMKRAEMSMTFRDFYDQFGKDAEGLMKFSMEAILPLQEATFKIDDPFGVGAVSEAAMKSMENETPQVEGEITDDLPF